MNTGRKLIKKKPFNSKTRYFFIISDESGKLTVESGRKMSKHGACTENTELSCMYILFGSMCEFFFFSFILDDGPLSSAGDRAIYNRLPGQPVKNEFRRRFFRVISPLVCGGEG